MKLIDESSRVQVVLITVVVVILIGLLVHAGEVFGPAPVHIDDYWCGNDGVGLMAPTNPFEEPAAMDTTQYERLCTDDDDRLMLK